MVRRVSLVVAALVLAASCSPEQDTAVAPDTSGEAPTETSAADSDSDQAPTPVPGRPGYTSDIYQDLSHWLCHPDRDDDACDIDLDITRVEADGTHVVSEVEPDPDAPLDCFYVYPTVSDDPGPNSDLEPDDSERRVARAQAAPFAPVCRLYAPVYRQITLAALAGNADGIADRGLAYQDVLDAWSHYLAHYNAGRGVVLIGHSQGAGHLRELLSRRIDPDPDERQLLVSAILLGTTVRVPTDSETGGHFQHVAPCADRDHTGCVVSYSTYAEDAPPGDAGLFAAVRDDPDATAVCTNPAAPQGGPSPLNSILVARPDRDRGVQTQYVHYPGLAVAECVRAGDHHYLEIRYRPRDTSWPPELGGRIAPQWGLHLLDVGVALGDLTDLVAHQGEIWRLNQDQPQ